MRIDLWSDLVCPWCYIGKRRFERAVRALSPSPPVDVVFRSFQLDPGLPVGSTTPQREILMDKYGMSAAQAEAAMRQAEQTAAGDGLEYHLIGGMTGNTLPAHELVHLAKERGVQDAVVERFYRAHFTEQRSLFDESSLVGLAQEAGLDPDEATAALHQHTYAPAVNADIAEARRLGISGVPFFIIDGRYGISGAQSARVFEDALTRARAERGA